ncbi:MAG: hypothetical protein JEZ05_04820 [Tenericutes bacterium]|nr:hypothetical protein [Mycoplasmatota bacterium]
MSILEKSTKKNYDSLKRRIEYFNDNYHQFQLKHIEGIVKNIIYFNGIVLFGRLRDAEYKTDYNSNETVFPRLRVVNGEDFSVFRDINQYYNLPSEKVKWEGRLNTINESLLYAAHKSFIVTVFETGAKEGDTVLLILYKKQPNCSIRLRKMAVDDDQIINLDNYTAKINDLKLNFIKYWLTKTCNPHFEEITYRITNSIKKIYFTEKNQDRIDGFIYPSTTRRKNDLNVAFKSSGIRKIYVESAFYGKVLKVGHNSLLIRSNYCFKGVQNRRICWEFKNDYIDYAFIVQS